MPTKIEDVNLYSVPEASEILHVTTVSVRNYIRQGHLKGRKLTGRWFITEDELKKFVKKHQNNSPKQIEEMSAT
jgi:predicted site-specific integrase-resolvase